MKGVAGRWTRLDGGVLLLCVAALLLYVPGILWGLPHGVAPDRVNPWASDELAPIGPLAQVYHVVFHGGSAYDPRYPLLPYLIQAVFMAPWLGWLRLTGGLAGFAADYPWGLMEPVRGLAGLTLSARISSLLMMAAVPVVAHATARRVWGRGTAPIAGVFVLMLYPMFYYSRTSNVDAGGLLWLALGLHAFASLLRDGLTPRRAAVLGVFAALATATKDQNYSVFLAIGIAAVVLHLRSELPVRGLRGSLRAPLVGLGTAAAVYVVATGLVFNPASFAAHVNFILFHPGGTSGQSYFSTPATPAGYARLIVEYARHVVDSMGLPMTVAALVGLGVAAVREPRMLLLALPAVAVLAGVVVPVRFVRIRFVIPVAYVLALFAAHAIARVAGQDTSPPAGESDMVRPVGWSRLLSRVAFAAIVLWSLVRGADLTWQMLQDSRYQLEAWFRTNARDGDRVGYYGSALKLPALSAGITIEQGPFAEVYERPDDAAWPEYIVIIPQQQYEMEHEWTLSEERFQELKRGDWDYEAILAVQAPSLFGRRPINWVNPPVRLFVRRDVVPDLADPTRRIELD